jgi:putative membrane protein
VTALRQVGYFMLMAWGFVAISWLVPGFEVSGWVPATLAAIVLAGLNTLIMPPLFVLTLPLTIVTLGFFLLVLNALMLWLTALLVPGFDVRGFFPLVAGSLLLAALGVAWKALVRSD